MAFAKLNLNQKYIQGGPKKNYGVIYIEEKCLRNSKMFFDGVFLSLYSHLLKKLELFFINFFLDHPVLLDKTNSFVIRLHFSVHKDITFVLKGLIG